MNSFVRERNYSPFTTVGIQIHRKWIQMVIRLLDQSTETLLFTDIIYKAPNENEVDKHTHTTLFLHP